MPVRVLCAPDSFKGTLTAVEAADAIARGVKAAYPNAAVVTLPIADGGEGTVDALLAATSGQTYTHRVVGPLGEELDASFGLFRVPPEPRTAVIEVASAAGLTLVPPSRRDPEQTTSYGVGQLIVAALAPDVERIMVGLGGSATVDGGLGLLQGVGVGLTADDGTTIKAPARGRDMVRVAAIDFAGVDPRLNGLEIVSLCDVQNPLLGPHGAAAAYGPQKGADPEQVVRLELGLTNVARVWLQATGVDVCRVAGAGAAGGIGAALAACFSARCVSGVDVVLDRCGFDRAVEHCDLCITGEGRLDASSYRGKAAVRVAQRARVAKVGTIAVVGQLADDLSPAALDVFDTWESCGGNTPDDPQSAAITLERACSRAVRAWCKTNRSHDLVDSERS